MRQIKIIGAVCIGLLITLIVVSTSPTMQAAELGATWQQPLTLSVSQQPFVAYGRLDQTGDAVYFSISVTSAMALPIRIDVPSKTNSKFAPQLAVFEPYTTTIGPPLPLEQPPQTIAMVYPMTAMRSVFNPMTQASYAVRLEANPNLETPGTYLLAVYNAGSAGGSFRLMAGDTVTNAGWQDTWMMPMYWWRDQQFAGFSCWTLLFPALLLLLAWFVYVRLDHHRLHVHKTYVRTKTKPRTPRVTKPRKK